MFNLIEPGHILRFGTCPSTIISPPATQTNAQDNTLETAWPAASNLGAVQCLSHPSGAIAPIAADVAKNVRSTPGSISRSASYSAVGRFVTSSNRVIGSVACDFVGYVDGQTNYINSAQGVFSKDFSGCLMIVYIVNGQRRVAHVAASAVPTMNCKQSFLTTLQNMNNTVLTGWFRPYVDALDGNGKVQRYGAISKYVGQVDHLVTFGVITQAGQAYAIEAFKPKGIGGNDWVVTDVSSRNLSQSFVAP